MTLASLPLLERVRPADPTRLAALAPLDVLLLERLGAGTGRPALPEAALLGVLEVEADAASPERLAPLVLGPASRFGSDRALLLELAARIGAQSDALRWLQLRAPGEAFEALASRPVAVELLALGGRIVGGPWPPVLAEDGALLTRI